MLRRYATEPVPSVTRAAADDDLAPSTSTDATTTTGVPELGEPEQQRGSSLRDHRAPIGSGVSTDVQSIGLGAEVKQAGAGRAFIPAGLAFPEQSPTPEPDRRRIARPVPTMARDQTEVVRPPMGAADA